MLLHHHYRSPRSQTPPPKYSGGGIWERGRLLRLLHDHRARAAPPAPRNAGPARLPPRDCLPPRLAMTPARPGPWPSAYCSASNFTDLSVKKRNSAAKYGARNRGLYIRICARAPLIASLSTKWQNCSRIFRECACVRGKRAAENTVVSQRLRKVSLSC